MNDQIQRLKVLGAGVFSLILVLGVARFSYTPLLPLMQHQAGLGLSEAGWLAAINYVGYLSGAIIASRIDDLVLKDKLYRIGIVVAVLSTYAMGMTTSFALWGLARFVAGLSTAAGLLLGAGLVLNWLIRHHHHSELGIHFSGIGLGVVFCSLTVAVINPLLDWDQQWFVFATLGWLLVIPSLAWLPPPDPSPVTKRGHAMHDRPPGRLFLRLMMAAYFCAGVGHVITTTFIVAIVDHLPGMEGQGNWVFLVIGLAAAPSCIVWDLISRRIGDLNALTLATLLQVFGVLLPLGHLGLAGIVAGAVLFGGTSMAIVSLVLTMAGRFYPTRPAKMMGQMTIAYGIAQILGPAITALIADTAGSYNGGLVFAAAVLAVGVLVLLALKRVAARQA